MTDDFEHLRRYARERSEPDFAELVRRHLDMVWGAARRVTGHRQGAGSMRVLDDTEPEFGQQN